MRSFLFAVATVLCGCASRTFDWSQYPFAIVPIEGAVSDVDVFAAVDLQVRTAPVCLPIPAAHWETSAPFTVRFGPTQWHDQAIPADAEQRLGDFVAMGFWTKEARPELGERVFQFTLTTFGERIYRGHPYRGGEFCPPAERRLLRVNSVERLEAQQPREITIGFYPPKSLGVRFEWIGTERPSWLPQAIADRYRPLLPDATTSHLGFQQLFRVWRRDRDSLVNAPQSGALEPFCYDNVHNRPEECWPWFNVRASS